MLSADQADETEWLIEVGRFVQDRWLAEERLREDGKDLDEEGCWHVWDECTEKQIIDLRSDAGIKLKGYVENKRAAVVADYITKTFRPVKGLVTVGGWIILEAVRGFIGGIGLIALGLLIVIFSPHIAKSVRAALDDALPVVTQPDHR